MITWTRSFETRYLPATDTRGARIKVIDHERGESAVYGFDHAARSAHDGAVETFMAERNIRADLLKSATPSGYVFTLVPANE